MEKELTYEAAYKELKQLTSEIENETVSVDVLAEKVKRLFAENGDQFINAIRRGDNNLIIKVDPVMRQ